MKDLTVIMTTANRVPESWAEFHKKILLQAIGDTPLITISFKPLDFGLNLIQTEYSLINLYRQLLRGAKTAETEFVAVAEDDTLYTRDHFQLRPPLDKIGYNLNRWTILTWGEPFYFHKPRIANCGMIAPRELLISALEERFNKFGDKMPSGLLKEIGRNEYERSHRITQIKTVNLYSKNPFLCFAHTGAGDPTQRNKTKRVWPVQAYDIPYWRKAEDIIRRFV